MATSTEIASRRERNYRGAFMPTCQVSPHLPLRKILFATDFSTSSERAFPFVEDLAEHCGSQVFVAHAYPAEFVYDTAPNLPALAFSGNRSAARERMNAFVERHDMRHRPLQVLLREGEVWPAIDEIIATQEIDLIVTGTEGRKGLKHLLTGSVAEEIIRRAPCPVLTVGPQATFENSTTSGKFHNILFATNFSPASEAALMYACSMAEALPANLTVLHVLEAKNHMPQAAHEPERMARASRQICESLLKGAELWCKPEIVIQSGLPGDAILSVARQMAADLIVLGAHSSAMPRASAHAPWRTVHHVVVEANCPVLTARGLVEITVKQAGKLPAALCRG
jgi:nucleotide-binding universal stress UspA family protein